MAKKRTNQGTQLPPMPLSELASMKALLAKSTARADDKATSKAARKTGGRRKP